MRSTRKKQRRRTERHGTCPGLWILIKRKETRSVLACGGCGIAIIYCCYQGKTVEVGRASFETDKKRFSILDAPGHAGFVPSMISGTVQADLGILVSLTVNYNKRTQIHYHVYSHMYM